VKKTYELNGATILDAMLWFSMHERERHLKDIAVIQRDIDALLKAGAKLPESPPIDAFVTVPGVDYER